MIELNSKEDLERLILERISEGLTLDYKRSASLNNIDAAKKDIAKDISAFANSEGGQIIYGIEEKDQIPIKLDDGILGINKISTLEDIINSNIFPRITNINIKHIPINLDSNRYAYVVEIPEMGPQAPHQNGVDQKY